MIYKFRSCLYLFYSRVTTVNRTLHIMTNVPLTHQLSYHIPNQLSTLQFENLCIYFDLSTKQTYSKSFTHDNKLTIEVNVQLASAPCSGHKSSPLFADQALLTWLFSLNVTTRSIKHYAIQKLKEQTVQSTSTRSKLQDTVKFN